MRPKNEVECVNISKQKSSSIGSLNKTNKLMFARCRAYLLTSFLYSILHSIKTNKKFQTIAASEREREEKGEREKEGNDPECFLS